MKQAFCLAAVALLAWSAGAQIPDAFCQTQWTGHNWLSCSVTVQATGSGLVTLMATAPDCDFPCPEPQG
ncbi:MAG: hypothetical protein FJY66_05515 [Calditrichaeota bacterium]|nr:hypothetical protein [Calditrichota bacterium]